MTLHWSYEWTHSLCAKTVVYHQSFRLQAENTAHRQKLFLKKFHSHQLPIQILTTLHKHKNAQEIRRVWVELFKNTIVWFMGKFPTLSPVNCQTGNNFWYCNKYVPLILVAVRMKNQTNDDCKETYFTAPPSTINHVQLVLGLNLKLQ